MRRHLCAFLLSLIGVAMALGVAYLGAKASVGYLGYLAVAPLLLFAAGVALEGSKVLLRVFATLFGGVIAVGGIVILSTALSWSGKSSSMPGLPSALALFVGLPVLLFGVAIAALVFIGTSGRPAYGDEGDDDERSEPPVRPRVRLAVYAGICLATVTVLALAGFAVRAREHARLAELRSLRVPLEAGEAFVWGTLAHARGKQVERDEGLIRFVAFSPDSRVLITAGGENAVGLVVKAWSTETGAELGTFYDAERPPAGALEVIGERHVRVTPEGEAPLVLALPTLTPVSDASLDDAPAHPPPARASRYRTEALSNVVHVLDAGRGKVIAKIPISSASQTDTAWSPVEDLLAVNGGQRTAIWRPDQPLVWLKAPKATDIAFSPDGRLLLLRTAVHAGIVDVASGELRFRLRSTKWREALP